MTHKESYNHFLCVLNDTKPHTITKHLNTAGKECWRIRDKKRNPIANIPDSIFREYVDNNLLTKINDYEWQLKAQKLN